MSIQLYRVDERLIHGQVTVGWGARLRPDRFIVVDDDVAGSEWEQDLYRLGLPDEVTVEFTSTPQARERLEGWRQDDVRSIVLVRDVETMLRLARGGLLDGVSVNIGGIHHAPGRKRVLPYVFLGDEDREGLEALAQEGVEITAQDLPGSRRVELEDLLK